MSDLPKASDLFPDPNDPDAAAKANGLDPKLFRAVLKTESSMNPKAVSSKGAVGMGQVLPSTAKSPGFGIEPFDPHDLNGSAKYLKKMIDISGGDTVMGLRRYKQGPNGELKTPSADAYVNNIVSQWKPKADSLFPDAESAQPAAPTQSAIAASPQAIGQPSPQRRPQAPQQGLAGQAASSLNRAANVTVQALQQAGDDMNNAVKEVANSPLSPKAWGKAGMAAFGVAGSPITSLTQGFLADPLARTANAAGVPQQYNQAIEQGTQLVAALAAPIAITKAPDLTKSLSTFGKFILGVGDTYDARLQAGQSANRLGYEIAGMEGRADAKMTQWLNNVKSMVPVNYQQIRQDIAHAFEDKGVALSPDAAAFKSKYLDPIAKETDGMYQQLAKITGQKYKPVDNYYPRVLQEQGKETSMPWMTPQDVGASRQSKPFRTSPPELQDRSTGAVHNWGTGEDAVYTTDKDTGKVLIWKDKQVVTSGELGKDANGAQVVKGGAGSEWHTAPGTMKDVEQHTNLQYVKDPIADLARANKDVFLALSNAKAIERLKTTPEWLAQAKPPGKGMPDGWTDAKELGLGTHQLDGWAISPRLQEVLHDAVNTAGVFDSKGLAKINRIIIGSLFFNPLPHIFNVATHSWVEKGLVSPGSVGGAVAGGAAGALANPDDRLGGAMKGAAIGAFGGSLVHSPEQARALWQGIKAVATRNEDYMRFMTDGAGLMYPARYTRDFYNNMLKMTGTEKAPPMMIKAFGLGNAKDLVSAFYNGSGNAMWFANDVIMMQGYLAKEEAMMKMGMGQGVAVTQAVKEVEKHVPNYRIPERVGPEVLDMIPGGAAARRTFSQILQGKTVPSFGRYDYGRIASYMNMFQDLASQGKTGGERMQAINQIAALGFGAMVVYPTIMDEVAKGVTGNPNASWQRFGPFTVPWAVYDYMNGGKTWPGLLSSMLPMAPAFRIGSEIYTNRDAFTDKSLHLPQDAFNFLMKQMTPVDQYQSISQGRVTPQQWLGSQFGIKNPTSDQVQKTTKFFQHLQKQEENWKKKQEAK